MLIRRLVVEGGFLDGLDLEFVDGLNVVIGPRGSGKTSVIELLRFGLGAPFLTAKSGKATEETTRSVLQDGRVTVVTESDGEQATFTRSFGEDSPNISFPVTSIVPTVLSQNEIEAVALDSEGRLHLIDGLKGWNADESAEERALVTSAASLTVEIRNLGIEVDSLEQQIADLRDIPSLLTSAVERQSATAASLADLAEEQQRLARVNEALAGVSVQRTVLSRMTEAVSSWRGHLEVAAAAGPQLEAWPDSATTPDPTTHVRSQLTEALGEVRRAHEIVLSILAELSAMDGQQIQTQVALQDEARVLRKRLNEVQEGAGALSREVGNLQEQAGQLSALKELLVARRERLVHVGEERGKILDRLDALRGDRSRRRSEACSSLNSELGPRIRVSLRAGGMRANYINALVASLRGSGLHYTTLAPQIAEELSPRELVELVETGESANIARIADIAEDRARRLVEHVRQSGTDAILTAALDDSVEFSLLDGSDYKSSDRLSTGQRCTVVLPILLARHREGLIIDQPEDNLDNAFVVDTLINAIRKEGSDTQLIFATHNPNIPVLGEAAQVVRMGSDGRRGFALQVGPLDSPEIIDAITSVMEGGLEAFRRRAKFYESRPSAE